MRHWKFMMCMLALAASLVTLLTQETVAYYTVSGAATNVITSGDIKMEIIEKMGDQDFPEEGVYVMPGSTIAKKVTVANIGNHPFWLRVKLENGIDDDSLSADLFELDLNLDDWTAGNDGFYYYNKPVQPGAVTEKLFTQVKIAGSMDTSYLDKTLTLTVKAYAVQSENNPATSPMNVLGWPTES